MFAALLMGTFTLISCQEEFEELPDSNDGKAIEASSSTAALIKDNDIDEEPFKISQICGLHPRPLGKSLACSTSTFSNCRRSSEEIFSEHDIRKSMSPLLS